jgi:hypothetical protein
VLIGTYSGPLTFDAPPGPQGLTPPLEVDLGWSVYQDKGEEDWDINWMEPLSALGYGFWTESIGFGPGEPVSVTINGPNVEEYAAFKTTFWTEQWQSLDHGTSVRNGWEIFQDGWRMESVQ